MIPDVDLSPRNIHEDLILPENEEKKGVSQGKAARVWSSHELISVNNCTHIHIPKKGKGQIALFPSF